ncbi:MAG TPA: hypothetical protein DEO60_03170 [Bacteroidales bacterium]|nr:hypothetical protein [Bacteroidales bacterium]HBZ20106.1 hypothetical protein [Bacteroidales bacterium]
MIINEKLKIGIILDDYIIQAWKYDIIKELVLSESAILSLIIKKSGTDPSDRDEATLGTSVYKLHRKADRLLFKNKSSYSQNCDSAHLLKNIPLIQVKPQKSGESEEFGNEKIDEIRRFNLDIILKLGFGHLKGNILEIPEYGVWAFSMDRMGIGNDGISGYYEVVQRNPVTISDLLILNKDGINHEVISRAYESTCTYSIELNRDKLFRRARFFPIRVIIGIHQHGKGYLESLKRKYKYYDRSDIVKQSIPGFKSSVKYFGIASVTLVQKSLKKIFYSDPFSWILLFNLDKTQGFPDYSFDEFKKIMPSKDKFWADPFVVNKNGKNYVFVEEFIYKKNKGHISVLELGEKGTLEKVNRVLEEPYHMSYPFIFESDGDYYMIPETSENKSIELYKCKEFPHNWIHLKSIMNNLNAVDSTLFRYKGKWWLFTVIDDKDSSLNGSPELFLFYTDDILSDNWTSHCCNPVVSDIRTARPAGKMFIDRGKIYRPSQDCSERYGQAFNINEVLVLSENEYEEIIVKKVEPYWDRTLKGAHTFNKDGDMTIIDAYSMRTRTFIN